MRAWRFDRWTRIARDRKSLRLGLPALILVVFVAGLAAAGIAQTASDSARTDENGIRVRVHEDRTRAEVVDRAREKVERVREQATRTAERAARAAAQAVPDVPEPPEPPNVHEWDHWDHSEGNDLVRFGEDITISENRVIEGDVVAVGGSITVLGRVKGDCVAVGGTVRVKGKGVVEGDAVSLGGGVVTSDSASITGSDVSVGKFDFGRMGRVWPAMAGATALGGGLWLVETLVGLVITLFLAWVSLLLLRRQLESAADGVHHRFGKSFLMGLLGWVLLVLAIPVGVIALIVAGVIAIVILCITIIGIPVAVLLAIGLVLAIMALVVAVVYAAFLGYLAGTMFLGRRLFGERVAAKPLYAIAAGAILIAVLDMAGDLIGTVSFFLLHPVGMAFGFAAALLCFIVTTAGLGALISGRFGATVIVADGGSSSGYAQWGSTPPQPPPQPPAGAPGPQGPTTAPPPEGSSDAP